MATMFLCGPRFADRCLSLRALQGVLGIVISPDWQTEKLCNTYIAQNHRCSWIGGRLNGIHALRQNIICITMPTCGVLLRHFRKMLLYVRRYVVAYYSLLCTVGTSDSSGTYIHLIRLSQCSARPSNMVKAVHVMTTTVVHCTLPCTLKSKGVCKVTTP